MRLLYMINLFFKGILGFHDVTEGSTCEFSYYFWDIHDYPYIFGGDGQPRHMYTYQCHKCGKTFQI